MEHKKWYQSTTIIGGIVSIIGMICMFAGVDVDTGMITELVTAVFTAIGHFMVFYGRATAKKQITF